MRVVLRLRLLQSRRSLRRWLRGLIENRWLVLLYSIAFAGGAFWAYSALPSALSQIVRTSSYPLGTTVTRTGLALLLILTWRELTRTRYPPVYLARGDISILLAGPIDRRTVIALRLVRAYASAGLAFAVPMILLGPFLVRIWDGISPALLALVWLHLSIGWISLIHWRWGAFHTERLKRIAYIVQWIGYALGGAALLALLVAWGIGPRISPAFAGEEVLAVAPGWTFPQLGAWSLATLAALAALSWLAVWRSIPRANLDGLVRFSLFVSDSFALRRGAQPEELEQVAARMRGTKNRRRKRAAIGYRLGVRAIAGKAVSMILRQSPVAFAFVTLMFVGSLFAFVYFPVLWGRALILSVIATLMTGLPLASLQQDLRNWAFARQLPFTEVEWVDGNAGILWGWQTALGWVFAWILFGRGMVAAAALLPLMAFLVAAGYLIAQQGILILIAEARSQRSLQFAVRLGCLASFALLAGVIVLPQTADVPPWTAWVAASGASVLLARVWRRIALRGMRTLIERPWENNQSQ